MEFRDIIFELVIAILCAIHVTCDNVLDLHPIMNSMDFGDPETNQFQESFRNGFSKPHPPIVSPIQGSGFFGPQLQNAGVLPPLTVGSYFNFPRIPIGFVGFPSTPLGNSLSPLAGGGKYLPTGGPPFAPVVIPNGQSPVPQTPIGVLHFTSPKPGPKPGAGNEGAVDPGKLMNTQAVGMVVPGPALAENKYMGPAVDPQHHLPVNHLFVPIPVLKKGGGKFLPGPPPPVFADILIVIDASEQMGHISPVGEVVWNPGVSNFVNQLVEATPMGLDLNRIGVVVVSSGIDDMIPLTHDKPFLLQSLTQLRPTFQGGCTKKGISTASSLFYQYGRPHAVKRIVLLGEGSSKCPYRNVAEIMYARKCGIDIVTVGFGPVIAPGMKGKYRSSWMVAGPGNLIDVVKPVAKRAYISPVHGGWSQWSAWNPCSSSGTCDIGYQMRFRLCDNPWPNYGGRGCGGYPAETRLCHMTPCIDKTIGHWSPWSKFTACSAPCGIGSQTRSRRCLTLDGRPSAMCYGKYVDIKECIVKQCPVHGGWSLWSAYGLCSTTCGTGVKIKVRDCDNPPQKYGGNPCQGPAVEEMVCDTGKNCPINGAYGMWSPWSACDAKCGMGKQVSERLCNSPLPHFGGQLCDGDSVSIRPCDSGIPCPVHGNWGPWGNYGGCTESCGKAVRVRERFCDSPPPSFGGAACQGSIVEEQPCDTGIMCPVHGGWSEWSKFGPCSVTCGSGFTKSFRQCNNPVPMYGGKICDGPDGLSKPCDTGVYCSIDGGWGSWSPFTKCSVKCGKGMIERSRECDKPLPQYGGALCVGLIVEEQMCNTKVSCPIHGYWSSWSAWGPCSASCETGFRQRHRLCDNPFPKFGGLECEGKPLDKEICDTGVYCPVAGGWSKWSAPLPCPVKCGSGITTRVRECNSPFPMYGGPDCIGPSFEPVDCDSKITCPIDGGWSYWGTWGSCDKVCGVGMRRRIRACSNPAPMYHGFPCKGPAAQAESCGTGVFCPVDGHWSIWGRWSPCSVTCGKGVVIRERMCDSPAPQYGGFSCEGKAVQKDICDTGMYCPINGGWSPWSSLSSCSVTCGAGVMYRSRTCDNPVPEFSGMPCTGPEQEKMPCDTSVYCPVHGNWEPWSDYSVCSVTCGTGFMARERLCNKPGPMYGGKPCYGDGFEKVQCDTGKYCPVHGGWSMWSEYSTCGVRCGVGVIQRIRACSLPAPQYGGDSCKGIDVEENICDSGMQCPIDGNWSPWSEYSACSKDCGVGFKQRQRQCNNPPPMYGGAYCLGTPLQKADCDTGIHCAINGGWTVWGKYGSCSATCGVGTRTKARLCTNPAPMYGGMDCVGPSMVDEPCNTDVKCPVHGLWSPWSGWSACSVVCSKGVTKRVRECTNPPPLYGGMPCKGDSMEKMECDTGIYCPIDGSWGPWGGFSYCSVKCAVGTRQRHRECNLPLPQYGGKQCVGDYTLTEPCDTRIPCPIDGGFSEWSKWGLCSVKCGDGVQTRSRLCDNPPPMYGGADCLGLYKEEQVCHSDILCPIHGVWGMWTAFSDCSATCGVGARERMRLCDSPVPMYKGHPCKGDTVDVQVCDTGMFCPVDGRWSLWTKWSACSVDCGVGLQYRTRSCTDPEPLFGGLYCAGDKRQKQVCNTGHPCPIHGIWGQWSYWTDCLGPCGMGSKTRTRMCNDPQPKYGGLPCEGPFEDAASCNTKVLCAIDGAWGKWQPWTKCSAVCGMGERSRVRLCDSPAPMYGGQSCYGKDAEIHTCDSLIPCAVHGGWSYWSPWSECSVNCGSGKKSRYRECTNPAPLYSGSMCEGPDKMSANCDTGIFCPVDGQWTMWTKWGVCKAECGYGKKYRYRQCTNPASAYGGKPCPGAPEEMAKCDTGIPCMIHGNWAGWSAWGKCVADCGMGFQTKVRACNDPTPMYGGKECVGPGMKKRPCDSGIPCPVNGNWSPWSEWDVCNAKCGEGFKYRFRTCTNPKPLYGGQMCVGLPEQKKSCVASVPCPVHGAWSLWTAWDLCDSKCGKGTHVRIRTCTKPRPQHGGKLCFGIPQEMRPCDSGIRCPIDGNWGHWTQWGSCDATCGKGRRSRFRDCDSPAPDHGGLPCLGFQSEVSACKTRYPCNRMGGWSLWGSWSMCPTTCGAGMQIRERYCTNPTPIGPGMDCKGPAEDSRICDTKVACPIHGQWSSWSTFGLCIADCSYGPEHAEGFKFRERYCSNPAPGNGGMDCVGDAVEKARCKDFPPCPEPVWGMWAKWNKCSAVCGPGDRTRTRTCIDMNTKLPIMGCKGQDTWVVPCMTRPCPLVELNCTTECKWDNGIGYANYPGDCSLFVQCESLNGTPQVHDCPWGLLYSLDILQCVFPHQSECKMCSIATKRIPYHISCRAYWQCTKGVPMPKCCPEGQMFDPFKKKCVVDVDGVCNQHCGPVKYQVSAGSRCAFRDSSLGSAWYEQDIAGLWMTRPCGHGTIFSIKDCGCVHYGEGYLGATAPISECKPELDLRFNTQKEDLARNVGLHVEGVKYLGDGTAYFDGKAAINSNIFSNAEWGTDVYVYIRFKPDMTRVKKQGLVHNSGCGPSDIGPSVFIGFDRENKALTGDTLNMKFATVPKQNTLQYDFVNITVPGQDMLDAWFTFGKGQFLAEVNGLTAALTINANQVARRHGALNIGGNLCRIGNEAFEGFVGTLDEVRIYKCKPKYRL